MNDLELTSETPAMPSEEERELRAKAKHLLGLTGSDGIIELDARIFLHEIADGRVKPTDRDSDIINGLFDQREREARLRGERWNWEGV